MRILTPGLEAWRSIVPQPEDTASAAGNPSIDVVATTKLILYIEAVSSEIAMQACETGEGNVGVRVEVDHLAPAQVGVPVEVKVRLADVRKRRLMFDAEIHQAGVLVMKGSHHRCVVPPHHVQRRELTPVEGCLLSRKAGGAHTPVRPIQPARVDLDTHPGAAGIDCERLADKQLILPRVVILALYRELEILAGIRDRAGQSSY